MLSLRNVACLASAVVFAACSGSSSVAADAGQSLVGPQGPQGPQGPAGGCQSDDQCASDAGPTGCCGGACIPLDNDQNCGGCGVVCAPPNAIGTCAGGTCAILSCAWGSADCDGKVANGCEVDIALDPDNCGACGQQCHLDDATAACDEGNCAVGACASGFANCDGAPANGCESSLLSDPLACGACGHACFFQNASSDCDAGACELGACAPGFGNCDANAADGCETPLDSLTNCGGCGSPCAPQNALGDCSSGSCAVAGCADGFGDCDGLASDGCEIDLDTSASHCGRCDRACEQGQTCIGGECTIPPAASCQAILANDPSAASGIYTIYIGGVSGGTATSVYCDMSTAGGGWTLVYAYGFTDYNCFGCQDNAVFPRPSWAANGANVEVSTTPPLSETNFGAIDYPLWSAIGSDVLIKSNINNWITCQPGGGGGGGDLVNDIDGPVTCQVALVVDPVCTDVAPTSYSSNRGGYGPSLSASQFFYYWDGNTTDNYPTHDPCGLNQTNQLTGVAQPHGDIFVR